MERDNRFPTYLARILNTAGNPIGTGFQVTSGWVITAFHVLRNLGCEATGSTVSIDAFAGGLDPISAEVINVLPAHDLALLQLERPLDSSVPGFAPSDEQEIG